MTKHDGSIHWKIWIAVAAYKQKQLQVFCKKKVFLEMSQNSHKNTYARASFLITLQALGLQLYLKIVSRTGVFLWILRNF